MTHTKSERQYNVRLDVEDVPCLGHLHYFYILPGGSVRTEPGQNVKCCLRRGDGKECPQYTYNTVLSF